MANVPSSKPTACSPPSNWPSAFVPTITVRMKLIYLSRKRPLENALGPLRFPQKKEEEDDQRGWPAKPTREEALVCAGSTNSRVLTTAYNCAQIKLTAPRDGGSLWEMPFNISTGASHDQEQDSEQDTRFSSSRQIDSRHRDQSGDRQKYGAQIPAPPRAGRPAASAAQSPLQTRSVQRASAAMDHRRSLLQL